MVVDRVAQLHRVLDLALHELDAFQSDLPASEVERGQDLVVRRGRRVRHVGLVEGLGHLLVEILVEDVDHRTLPQRRQGLMRRLRRVYPHSRLRRIGISRRFTSSSSAGGSRPLPISLRTAACSSRRTTCPAASGGRHRRAVAVHRVEAREREPRLVPQEYQVGLDGQHSSITR